MMTLQVPEHARMEIKFISDEVHLDHILHWLHLHPSAFTRPFPDRWVKNVYFDTWDCRAFSENLGGASLRAKVRYRWYGESKTPEAGMLEIKRKRNLFGWKLQYKVAQTPYQPRAGWKEIRHAMLAHLSPEGRRWLEDNPLPVLINRYRRRYFESADGKIRATVDTALGIWDQRFDCRPNYRRQANLPAVMVVEFKFARRDRDLASDVVRTMPLRVSRFSKYASGLLGISSS